MNKKYNVYGMGNALVDMEFEVTPALLSQLKIDKGVMTLMDEAQQKHIIEQLPPPCKQACGGSAANTLVAISQLGGKGFYSCKVAHDDSGAFYLQDLINCGLDTNLRQNNRPEGITGKCLVLVTPDADRTMNTFLGITGNLSTAELNPEAIKDSQYLYIEGYLVSSPIALESAIEAKKIAQQAGVKVSFSLSDANMVNFFREGVEKIIGDGVDLLFANQDEALKMANTDDLTIAVDYFKTLAKTFAITLGKKGSLIFDGEKLMEIPPYPVTAVDTVGAGDMYAGCLLYGITNGLDWYSSGKLASLASAKLVTSFGPRLLKEELQEILEDLQL
ncbi:adenosine kinase [Cyanobacterium stanieri LEGE 03274]|uniref:Adenosine kinase n=1 Tax=Cyanobacterium stanieri LEGE 03274 TaxID=1828756 RepID=A0ABR9V6V0_9CHRO|nr:adenosine kinase [Cyanobacterium stanieri]MBE9223632.1 adenosine kinase [Cyanobacterium stanieri LEGE 03274]